MGYDGAVFSLDPAVMSTPFPGRMMNPIAAPVWLPGADAVTLPKTKRDSTNANAMTGGYPPSVRELVVNTDDPQAEFVGAAPSASGTDILAVDQRGRIYTVTADSGNVRSVFNAWDEPLPENQDVRFRVAIDSASDLVALAIWQETDVPIRVVAAGSGEVQSEIPRIGLQSLSFAADDLLIQRTDGRLEVWDKAGRSLKQVIPGDAGFVRAVGSPNGQIIARIRSDYSVGANRPGKWSNPGAAAAQLALGTSNERRLQQ